MVYSIILFFVFIGYGYNCFSQPVVKSTMSKNQENTTIATLDGGCFWCIESEFEKIAGGFKGNSQLHLVEGGKSNIRELFPRRLYRGRLSLFQSGCDNL
jgi:hypothetical protein